MKIALQKGKSTHRRIAFLAAIITLLTITAVAQSDERNLEIEAVIWEQLRAIAPNRGQYIRSSESTNGPGRHSSEPGGEIPAYEMQQIYG